MTLFAELKRAIRHSGMTPYALAARAGTTPQTINNWLEGRVKQPELANLVAVAKVLGYAVELTDGGARLVDTPATVAAKMSRAREFVGLWRRYQ